jgi:hypothetical protein
MRGFLGHVVRGSRVTSASFSLLTRARHDQLRPAPTSAAHLPVHGQRTLTCPGPKRRSDCSIRRARQPSETRFAWPQASCRHAQAPCFARKCAAAASLPPHEDGRHHGKTERTVGILRSLLMNSVIGAFDRTLVVAADPTFRRARASGRAYQQRGAHAAEPPAERKLRWVHQTTAASDEAGGAQALEF